MLKVQTYRVHLKEQPSYYYYIEAPSKRIAKWCAAAIFEHEYTCCKKGKDFKAKRYHYMP